MDAKLLEMAVFFYPPEEVMTTDIINRNISNNLNRVNPVS